MFIMVAKYVSQKLCADAIHQFCCGCADRPRLDGACDGEKIFNIWTAVAGGWLATNAIECWFANTCKLVAGSHKFHGRPPKSITTYLTYHDSAMTLSMFNINYIEIRE
jgi:hypothetical protein